MAEGWLRDCPPARLTVSLSPSLLEILRDEFLLTRYAEWTHSLLDLPMPRFRRNKDYERFRFTAEINRARLVDALDRFECRYSRDLVAAFAALKNCGILEIVTSCATHAFLPCFDAKVAYQDRLIRYIRNHDEPRCVSHFGS